MKQSFYSHCINLKVLYEMSLGLLLKNNICKASKFGYCLMFIKGILETYLNKNLSFSIFTDVPKIFTYVFLT